MISRINKPMNKRIGHRISDPKILPKSGGSGVGVGTGVKVGSGVDVGGTSVGVDVAVGGAVVGVSVGGTGVDVGTVMSSTRSESQSISGDVEPLDPLFTPTEIQVSVGPNVNVSVYWVHVLPLPSSCSGHAAAENFLM